MLFTIPNQEGFLSIFFYFFFFLAKGSNVSCGGVRAEADIISRLFDSGSRSGPGVACPVSLYLLHSLYRGFNKGGGEGPEGLGGAERGVLREALIMLKGEVKLRGRK